MFVKAVMYVKFGGYKVEFESSGLSREEIRKRRRKKERTQAMLLLAVAILVVVLLIGGGVFLVMRLEIIRPVRISSSASTFPWLSSSPRKWV